MYIGKPCDLFTIVNSLKVFLVNELDRVNKYIQIPSVNFGEVLNQ